MRTDGGSRGNPGPAGAGFVVQSGGATVCRGGRFLGVCTNNVAEYEALISGLECALALGYDDVTVYADSELLVRQMNGQYRVKNANLRPLFERARELLARFQTSRIAHVRREQNTEADALANEAMDCRGSVGDAPIPAEQERPADTLF